MEKEAKVMQNFMNPLSLMVFHMLLDFVGILREAKKLFFKNGKLISSITLRIIFLSSILLMLNIFLIREPMTYFAFDLEKDWSPTNFMPTLNFHIRFVVVVEWIFIFVFSFTSLFFTTASILASAVTYCGKDLSIKELLSRAVESLKRPFVTWFYITLIDLGYCLCIAFLLPLELFFNYKFTISAFSIIIFILALVFHSYLAVFWNLALIVSVLEEKWGIEALGKAGQLINGSKRRGFVLNLFGTFSTCVFYGLVKVFITALPNYGLMGLMIPLVVVNSISCLIRMFLIMAYTVLYYECKETHGEELEILEILESTGYTKVTDTPLISGDAV